MPSTADASSESGMTRGVWVKDPKPGKIKLSAFEKERLLREVARSLHHHRRQVRLP